MSETKKCSSCLHIYFAGEEHLCPPPEYYPSRDALILAAAEEAEEEGWTLCDDGEYRYFER